MSPLSILVLYTTFYIFSIFFSKYVMSTPSSSASYYIFALFYHIYVMSTPSTGASYYIFTAFHPKYVISTPSLNASPFIRHLYSRNKNCYNKKHECKKLFQGNGQYNKDSPAGKPQGHTLCSSSQLLCAMLKYLS